jgi:hypothetical protein
LVDNPIYQESWQCVISWFCEKCQGPVALIDHIAYHDEKVLCGYDMTNSERLFLKAYDNDGCDLISSLLQDSLLHFSAISFHMDRRCLRLMLNRFCWETAQSTLADFEKTAELSPSQGESDEHCVFRVHSGLYIHDIVNITVNDNFKNVTKTKYINLLAMHAANTEISMLFSDHMHMYIKTNGLCVHLRDLHAWYPSPSIPKHG